MKTSFGFSLLEVLITIAIVAALAGIAFPNYAAYIERTRRTDAQEKLLDLAAQMERSFIANNRYPADDDDAFDRLGGRLSRDGYYTVTITNEDPFSTYVLTATPVDDKSQANDTDCTQFTIDNTGRRASTNSANDDSTAICWRS